MTNAMIFTFGGLHHKLIHEKGIPEKLVVAMVRGLWPRIDEVKESKFIPFLLIIGKPNKEDSKRTLSWFFPEMEAE